MKPWWKKMTIIACCILCAGVVLSGIGWALGGEIVTLEGSLLTTVRQRCSGCLAGSRTPFRSMS